MNFGQRYLELSTAFTKASDTGLVTLYVSQMPPNSNIFQPGPAMIFLVVDGIPSEGQVRDPFPKEVPTHLTRIVPFLR